MIDIVIYFLLKYAYVLAILLFVVKVFFFVKNRNKSWTLLQFFYFPPDNIQFTPSAERAKRKRLQNQLSIGIITFVVIQLAIKVMLT